MKFYSPFLFTSIIASFIFASANKDTQFDLDLGINKNADHSNPNYSIFLGLNYSDFLLKDANGSINYTFGLCYQYPLIKYIHTSFGVFIAKRNIELNDKIYQNDFFSDLELYNVDIIYQAHELFLPLGVSFSYPFLNNTIFYTSIGLGFSFYFPDSEVEIQYIIEEKVDYDYYHSEGWRKPLPYRFVAVGVKKDKSFIKLEIMIENKTIGRMLSDLHLQLTEKLYSIQLLYGYSFSF